MALEYANNAATTLAGSITSTQTTITVAAGTGSLFPVIGTGPNQFYITLADAASLLILEICLCTARVGDVFTVVRATQGTGATPGSVGYAFTSGDIVAQLMTAGDMQNFLQSGSYVLPNAVTFNNSGSGAASGASFDGSAAKTISYNTVGAVATATFTGTNQQLGASGFQKFPGGLIMQWGKLTGVTLGSGPQTVAQSFVFTFPTACVNVQLTGWGYGNSAGQNSASINPPTLYASGGTVTASGFTWIMENLSNLNGLHWFAIGY